MVSARMQTCDRCAELQQQIEMIEVPLRIDEHRGLAYWCRNCRRVHYASIPSEVVQAGLAGPRLTALVAFLKGVCHASFSTIRRFLRDVAGVTISRGQLAKPGPKMCATLEPNYQGLPTTSHKKARVNRAQR